MDSKYALVDSNRSENQITGFKRTKPCPVVFKQSKKNKLNEHNGHNSHKNTNSHSSHNGRHITNNYHEQRRSLPIFAVRNRLLEEIKRQDTVIVMAETGSGKTTQIPQYIHSARLENNGQIAITQPRRVAAITIAQRVADEASTKIGHTVGYTVRFEDVTSKHTKIKYLTDGMLLREAMADNLLMSYNVIILDEAHERTVHTDVLFGIVKQAQVTRKTTNVSPLKIIIMSATMDIDEFSKYFDDCKILYLEGRCFPVYVHHAVKSQEDYQYSCLVTLFQIHKESPANEDILIFLTGQEEIESMVQNIRLIAKHEDVTGPSLKVYPLYASLPNHQQLDAFRPTPPGMRKVILSTNIAETSLTITGIKYVIDSGMVKARTHHPGTGLDMLRVHRISQAQAWQRAGRAGRESEGHCYRMYTKEEFTNFLKSTVPEILRCNLSSVCLHLLALGIDINNFDFMDKPPKDAIAAALFRLHQLGAIDDPGDTKLTKTGKQMAQFPLDPKYSKILLAAQEFKCLEEVVSIVALLSSESIYITPSAKREQALAARQKYMSTLGDHISLLNVYRAYNSSNEKKLWCHENYINSRNLMYAKEVRAQLMEICQRCGIQLSSCGSNMDQVRKCLLKGLFMNVAELQNEKKYVTMDSKQVVSIHPSSVLHGSYPHCVIFTEVIMTGKCYLRNVCTVNPEWLQEIVPEYFSNRKLTNTTINNR